jgi:diguanylate cyclase (GGDEF)-like protein
VAIHTRQRSVAAASRLTRRTLGALSRFLRMQTTGRAASETEAVLRTQLEQLRAQSERERAGAAKERAQFEAELQAAHLDQLTGAYRREMGRLALSHEIDRARRGDGRFVLAFVDVDGLKRVNDHNGHAAGDGALKTVVRAMRAHLRSFDPIMRYGGDEFVAGLGGADLEQAERRFALIRAAIVRESGVAISVGLAALTDDESADQLTERADAAMLEARAEHRALE